MKFTEFLNEGLMDDRENDKFRMRAKVNGKEKSAKRINGGYYYYNDVSKKWVVVSKSMITFTERTREEIAERQKKSRQRQTAANEPAPNEND